MILKAPLKTAIYFLLVSSNRSQLQNIDDFPHSIQYFFSANIILRCIGILPLQSLLLSFLNLSFLFSFSFFFYFSQVVFFILLILLFYLFFLFLYVISFHSPCFTLNILIFTCFFFIFFFYSLYGTSFLRKTEIRTGFLIFHYGTNRRNNCQ